MPASTRAFGAFEQRVDIVHQRLYCRSRKAECAIVAFGREVDRSDVTVAQQQAVTGTQIRVAAELRRPPLRIRHHAEGYVVTGDQAARVPLMRRSRRDIEEPEARATICRRARLERIVRPWRNVDLQQGAAERLAPGGDPLMGGMRCRGELERVKTACRAVAHAPTHRPTLRCYDTAFAVSTKSDCRVVQDERDARLISKTSRVAEPRAALPR